MKIGHLQLGISLPAVLGRDFQLILVGAALLLSLIFLGESAWFLKPLRLALGLLYIVFAPGYCLGVAFFPRKDSLDGIERTGISIGLSIAMVPILALLLDRLPWGIQLWPILLAQGGVTALAMGIGQRQRARLPTQAAYLPELRWRWRPWWLALPPAERRVHRLIGGALLLAALSIGWILLVPSSKEFMTEFYILGKAGQAESYPYQVTTGDTLRVTMGITNRERTAQTYRVEIWVADTWESNQREQVGVTGPITLAPGQTAEQPLSWRMPRAGDDQQIEFLLFTGNNPEPYRQLRLRVNVGEGG